MVRKEQKKTLASVIRVNDVIKRLKTYSIYRAVADSWASEHDSMRECGVQLHSVDDAKESNCLIVAVTRKEFKALNLDNIKKLYKDSSDDEKVLLDVKGLYTVKNGSLQTIFGNLPSSDLISQGGWVGIFIARK